MSKESTNPYTEKPKCDHCGEEVAVSDLREDPPMILCKDCHTPD